MVLLKPPALALSTVLAPTLALGLLVAPAEADAAGLPTPVKAKLGLEFDYPVHKEFQLANIFGFPEYENLTVPVYKSHGTHGPGILLVHGNSSSSRSYARQVFGALGNYYEIYLIDLPGFGNAGEVDPGRPFPTDALGVPVGFPEYQLGWVEAVALAAADPEIDPAIVAGWSLGGDIALITQGLGLLPNVEGLFIFGTSPSGANPPTTEAPFLAPDVPGLPGLAVLASFGFGFQFNPASPLGFDLFGDFLDPVPPYAAPPISDAPTIGDAYMAAFFDDDQRAWGYIPPFFQEDGFDRADPRTRSSLGALVLTLPPNPALDELAIMQGLAGDPADPDDDVALAVLVGEEDAFVNVQYLHDLADAGYLPTLWGGEVIEVEGAGHAIHWDRPLAFSWYLHAFTSSVAG